MKAYNVTSSGSGKPQTGSTRTQHIDSGVQSSCKQLTEESLSQQLQSSHAPAPPKKKKNQDRLHSEDYHTMKLSVTLTQTSSPP